MLHAAIDGAPADLTSDAKPGEILQTSTFADVKGYVSFPKGQHNATVTLRVFNDSIFNVPLLIVGDADRALVERVRAACQKRLPPWLLPTLYGLADRLPRTPNEKVDLAAVRASFLYGEPT